MTPEAVNAVVQRWTGISEQLRYRTAKALGNRPELWWFHADAMAAANARAADTGRRHRVESVMRPAGRFWSVVRT